MKQLKNIKIENSVFSNARILEKGFHQPLPQYVKNIAQTTFLKNTTLTNYTIVNPTIQGGTLTNSTFVSNYSSPSVQPLTIQNGILSDAFLVNTALLSPVIYKTIESTPVFEIMNDGEIQISQCNVKGGNSSVPVNEPVALDDFSLSNFNISGCAIRNTNSIDSQCDISIGSALYPLFHTYHWSTHNANATAFPRASICIVDTATPSVYRYFGAQPFTDATRTSASLPVSVANFVCKQIGNLIMLHLYIRFDEYATDTADLNNFRMYINNYFFPNLPQPDSSLLLGIDADGSNPNYDEYVELYSMTTRIRYGGASNASTVSSDGSYGTSVSNAAVNISNYPLSVNAQGMPPTTTTSNWNGPNLAFRVTTDYYNIVTMAVQGFYFTN
jgi:hypothetical protein